MMTISVTGIITKEEGTFMADPNLGILTILTFNTHDPLYHLLPFPHLLVPSKILFPPRPYIPSLGITTIQTCNTPCHLLLPLQYPVTLKILLVPRPHIPPPPKSLIMKRSKNGTTSTLMMKSAYSNVYKRNSRPTNKDNSKMTSRNNMKIA